MKSTLISIFLCAMLYSPTVLPYEFTPSQLSCNLLASTPELCPGLSQISCKAQPVNVSLVNTNRNHWLLVRSATQQFCLIYSRYGDMCVFLPSWGSTVHTHTHTHTHTCWSTEHEVLGVTDSLAFRRSVQGRRLHQADIGRKNFLTSTLCSKKVTPKFKSL